MKDSHGRPACFALHMDDKTIMMKHSSIPKVILEEQINKEDVLTGYPAMLPNSKHLDLTYALECELDPSPNYWID